MNSARQYIRIFTQLSSQPLLHSGLSHKKSFPKLCITSTPHITAPLALTLNTDHSTHPSLASTFCHWSTLLSSQGANPVTSLPYPPPVRTNCNMYTKQSNCDLILVAFVCVRACPSVVLFPSSCPAETQSEFGCWQNWQQKSTDRWSHFHDSKNDPVCLFHWLAKLVTDLHHCTSRNRLDVSNKCQNLPKPVTKDSGSAFGSHHHHHYPSCQLAYRAALKLLHPCLVTGQPLDGGPSSDSRSSFPLPVFFARLSLVDHASTFPVGSRFLGVPYSKFPNLVKTGIKWLTLTRGTNWTTKKCC